MIKIIKPKFKVGDKVIKYGKSWQGDARYRVRGIVIGVSLLKKGEAEGVERATYHYHIKTNIDDVNELYDVDREGEMMDYNNPMSTFIPASYIKKYEGQNISWGYY